MGEEANERVEGNKVSKNIGCKGIRSRNIGSRGIRSRSTKLGEQGAGSEARTYGVGA